MLVYIIGTVSSCLIMIFFNLACKGKNKNSFMKAFISLLPLTIISAIRYDVGWDYLKIYTYGFYFNSLGIKGYFGEEAFNLLNRLIYRFTTNVDWLFIICSIIIAIFLSKAIKDQAKNMTMSILLVFLTRYFFLTMNIVRQGIAMSIILYSLKFIKAKEFKKYAFCVILAYSIHNMAVIFLPFYFIANINFFKGYNKLLLMFSPAILIASQKIILEIIKGTKYINYFGSQFDGNEFLITEIIINSLILLFGVLNYKKKNDEYYYIYFNMQVIAFVLSIFSKYIPVVDRIIWFFSVQQIFFIPLILRNYKREKKLITGTVILTYLTIVVMMQTLLTDSYSILPYNTIFNKPYNYMKYHKV